MDYLGDEDPFYLAPSLNQGRDIAESEHSTHSSTFHEDGKNEWDALHEMRSNDIERARVEEELKHISADLERTKYEDEQANLMFGHDGNMAMMKPYHYDHASSYTATTVPIETASVGSSSRHFDMSSLRNSANYIINETQAVAYSDSNVMQPQTIRSAGYAPRAPSSCTSGWTPNGNGISSTSNHFRYDHGAASVISESINSENGTYHLQQNGQNIDNFQRACRRGSNDVSIYSEPGIVRSCRGPGSRYAQSEISDCGKRSIASLDYDMQPERTIKRRASLEVGGMKQEFTLKEAEPANDPIAPYEYYHLPGRTRMTDDDDEEEDDISCGDLDDLEGLDIKNFDWNTDHENVDLAEKELSSHSMPNEAFTYGANLSTFSSFGRNNSPLSFSGAQPDAQYSTRKIEVDMTSCKSAPVFTSRLETHKESSEDEDNSVESLEDTFLKASENHKLKVESKQKAVITTSGSTVDKSKQKAVTTTSGAPKISKPTRKKKVKDISIEDLALNPEGNDADDRMVYKSELKKGGLKNIGTQFCKYTLREFKKTEFGEGDLIGKRRGLELGYPGLACAHCAGKIERRLGGRYFPSTIKTLSDTKKSLLSFYSHLLKCNDFPVEKKMKLQEYYTTHEAERATQNYGSQKKFFVLVWHRLHKDSPFKEEGKKE